MTPPAKHGTWITVLIDPAIHRQCKIIMAQRSLSWSQLLNRALSFWLALDATRQ